MFKLMSVVDMMQSQSRAEFY